MSNAKQCDCCRTLFTNEIHKAIREKRKFAVYTDNTKNAHEIMLDLCPDCQSLIENVLGVPGEFKKALAKETNNVEMQ